MSLFGGSATSGYYQRSDELDRKRTDMLKLFEDFKRNNPNATVEEYESFLRSAAGDSFYLRGAIPARSILQRMADENQERQRLEKESAAQQALKEKLALNREIQSSLKEAALRTKDPQQLYQIGYSMLGIDKDPTQINVVRDRLDQDIFGGSAQQFRDAAIDDVFRSRQEWIDRQIEATNGEIDPKLLMIDAFGDKHEALIDAKLGSVQERVNRTRTTWQQQQQKRLQDLQRTTRKDVADVLNGMALTARSEADLLNGIKDVVPTELLEDGNYNGLQEYLHGVIGDPDKWLQQKRDTFLFETIEPRLQRIIENADGDISSAPVQAFIREATANYPGLRDALQIKANSLLTQKKRDTTAEDVKFINDIEGDEQIQAMIRAGEVEKAKDFIGYLLKRNQMDPSQSQDIYDRMARVMSNTALEEDVTRSRAASAASTKAAIERAQSLGKDQRTLGGIHKEHAGKAQGVYADMLEAFDFGGDSETMRALALWLGENAEANTSIADAAADFARSTGIVLQPKRDATQLMAAELERQKRDSQHMTPSQYTAHITSRLQEAQGAAQRIAQQFRQEMGRTRRPDNRQRLVDALRAQINALNEKLVSMASTVDEHSRTFSTWNAPSNEAIDREGLNSYVGRNATRILSELSELLREAEQSVGAQAPAPSVAPPPKKVVGSRGTRSAAP